MKLFKLPLAYLLLVLIFLVSLTVSCLIPSSIFKKNIGKSLPTLMKEGTYPLTGPTWRPVLLDNFTDPLMLNTSYSVDSTQPFKSALLGTRYAESKEQINQITNLEKLYKNTAHKKLSYERYWHGYLIFLRPLLVFFSYGAIRIILTILLYLFMGWFLYEVWKKLGVKYLVSFTVGLCATDVLFLGKSMQFSSVYLIAFVSGIIFLKKYKKDTNSFTTFFVVGGLTAFFDLLTAPLVTLGSLLILSKGLDRKQNTLLNSIFWSVGYMLLWATKWIIVEKLYSPGAIMVSINQIFIRTSTQADTKFTHLAALKLNFFQMIGYARGSKIIVLMMVLLMVVFMFRYLKINKTSIFNAGAWLIIMIIPYAWYFVAANHSYVHCWFTYRTQFMAVVAGMLFYFEFFNGEKLHKDWLFLHSKLAAKNHKK